ncbi:MAG: prephenate dehydrogenase/arogenate dehydrogenase family protein [Pseudomonadales bacterium]
MTMQIAILGLGLIGGSMAAGLRQQGNRIVAFDKFPASVAKGLELGVIDDAASSVAEAVANADIVVLAVPVLAVEQVLAEIPEDFHGVLTDVGSVKQPILDALRNVYGTVPEHFVAGHPIAGSEQHGVMAANPDLFRQHRVLLTPLENTHAGAIQQVQSLWQSLGAEVSTMSVEHHDRVLGQTSHLPHLLAFSLIDTLSSQGNSLEIFEYAAGGLRDFSRIAASDPTMWGDIFLSNRSALLQILDEFSEDLAALRETIEQGDREDLLARLERSKAARDHFTQVLLRRTKPEGEA